MLETAASYSVDLVLQEVARRCVGGIRPNRHVMRR